MQGLQRLGIDFKGKLFKNLSSEELINESLKNEPVRIMEGGAVRISTGERTGRSPKDRFIVKDAMTENTVDFGKVNAAFDERDFDALYKKAVAYIGGLEKLYVLNAYAGADKDYKLNVTVINENASHNLFMKNMLIETPKKELKNYTADFFVIGLPNFKCVPAADKTRSDAAVIINFSKKLVLVLGTGYCGEMKKSVFSVMNYLLPLKNILSMHCSANMDLKTKETALFFGLSGTGKTTLSADVNRGLIGDDETGWSDKGIFNIEGGCYAKCINLSKEKEPQIYAAIKRGAVVENVVLDENGRPDYDDDTITENTRACYPLDYIDNAVIPSVGGHPKTIIFLTADAFGVLPPIAVLDKRQAMHYFMKGYTSKLAGTELGVITPEATFSACFGAPFLPLAPAFYAKMLGERIEKHNAKVYLVNTGWTGGGYGAGKRIPLKYTRAMVTAAINGKLESAEFETECYFNLNIPKSVEGVPPEVLNPVKLWRDKEEYDKVAKKLAAELL
jgi:phosphoenolpyruvate carboxykinase (ATP)